MVDRMTRLFFDLLKISAGVETAFPLLSSQEWEILYGMARKQSMLGLMFGALEHLDKELWPDRHFNVKLYANAGTIRKCNELADKATLKASDAAAAAGFATVVLKGQGLAGLYPDPGLRSPGDVDIWCDAPRQVLVDYARSDNPDARVFYHHVGCRAIGRIPVELHFTPTWMNSPIHNARLQAFFREWKAEQFANRTGLASGSVCVPTPAFNRVFLLVHIYRHLFAEGVGLRQVMDYFVVLRQGCTPEEKLETMCVVDSLGMHGFAAALMWVLSEVFGLGSDLMLTAPDERRGRFLLDEMMISGSFGLSDTRTGRGGFGKMKRLCRFVFQYPSEVLWSPVFKLWQILFVRLKYNKIVIKI